MSTSPRSPRSRGLDLSATLLNDTRKPLQVYQFEKASSSARPSWDTRLLQTHGPNSVRKLPEKQQHLPVEGVKELHKSTQFIVPSATSVPVQQTGLHRVDDQRPNCYVSEHKYLGPHGEVQITQISEPHTDWECRLPDRPWCGSLPEKHLRCKLPKAYIGYDPKLNPITKDMVQASEFKTILRSRVRARSEDLPGSFLENEKKWLCRKMKEEKIKHPYLHSYIDGPGARWAMMKNDFEHNQYLIDRREHFMQHNRRAEHLWFEGRNRRTGFLAQSEVRSTSCPKSIHQSMWPNRLPWLYPTDSPKVKC